MKRQDPWPGMLRDDPGRLDLNQLQRDLSDDSVRPMPRQSPRKFLVLFGVQRTWLPSASRRFNALTWQPTFRRDGGSSMNVGSHATT